MRANAPAASLATIFRTSRSPIGADMPAMFVPLQELENLAPGSWYVNVLAVQPQFRGRGLGTQLLDLADAIAAAHRSRGLSVIVADANTGARRLYERCGYARACKPRHGQRRVAYGEHALGVAGEGPVTR